MQSIPVLLAALCFFSQHLTAGEEEILAGSQALGQHGDIFSEVGDIVVGSLEKLNDLLGELMKTEGDVRIIPGVEISKIAAQIREKLEELEQVSGEGKDRDETVERVKLWLKAILKLPPLCLYSGTGSQRSCIGLSSIKLPEAGSLPWEEEAGELLRRTMNFWSEPERFVHFNLMQLLQILGSKGNKKSYKLLPIPDGLKKLPKSFLTDRLISAFFSHIASKKFRSREELSEPISFLRRLLESGFWETESLKEKFRKTFGTDSGQMRAYERTMEVFWLPFFVEISSAVRKGILRKYFDEGAFEGLRLIVFFLLAEELFRGKRIPALVEIRRFVMRLGKEGVLEDGVFRSFGWPSRVTLGSRLRLQPMSRR